MFELVDKFFKNQNRDFADVSDIDSDVDASSIETEYDTIVENLNENINDDLKDVENIDDPLEEALAMQILTGLKFESIKQVKEIVLNPYNLRKERKKTQPFHQGYDTESQYKELEKQGKMAKDETKTKTKKFRGGNSFHKKRKTIKKH